MWMLDGPRRFHLSLICVQVIAYARVKRATRKWVMPEVFVPGADIETHYLTLTTRMRTGHKESGYDLACLSL